MNRRERVLVVLIFALAAALGMQAALEWQDGPFGAAPLLDEEGYIAWARRIAAGEVIGKGVFYQDPLWPYLLAGLFRLLGGDLLYARLAQVGLALGTLSFTFLFARRLFGKREAILSIALLSLCGVHAYYQSVLLKATLAAFLCTLSLWLAARADQERRSRDFFALGAALAAFSLVRGNGLALAVLAAATALWPFAGERKSSPWLRFIPLCAGLALLLFPVALRNRLAGGEWVLTTSQAGQNFYLGNNERADGTYVTLPFVRAEPQFEEPDFRAEAERLTGAPLKPTAVSRFWLRAGARFLVDHPGDAARLWARKLWLLLHGYEIPDNESFACMRRWFMPSLRFGFLGWGTLVAPALLGMALALREKKRCLLPVLSVLTYGATLVAFFIVSRYRYPLLPAAAVFAAHFAVAIFDAARARAVAFAAAGAGLLLLGAILLQLPSPISARDGEYLAHCAQTSGTALMAQRRLAEALPLLEEAARLQPESADHRFNLGVALQKQGDARGAEAAYRESLRLAPADAGARRNLVLLFLGQRRCDEARALVAAAAVQPSLAAQLADRCGTSAAPEKP